jgi:hypothetical protein
VEKANRKKKWGECDFTRNTKSLALAAASVAISPTLQLVSGMVERREKRPKKRA